MGPEAGQMFVFLAFVGGIVLVALIAWASAKAAERRRALLAEFAARHGFVFDPNAANDLQNAGCLLLFGSPGGGIAGQRLLQMFEGFEPFGKGHSKRISDVVMGSKGDRSYYFFQYRYTTGSGKDQSTWNFGIAAIRLPLAFSPITIRPENMLDRFGGMLGLKDLQFEAEEFNKAYYVKCQDERFAFDLIHPQAIEYLLRTEPRSWQFCGPLVVVHQSGSFDPFELERVMADMDGFLNLVPDYLRQDIGFNPTWRSPLD